MQNMAGEALASGPGLLTAGQLCPEGQGNDHMLVACGCMQHDAESDGQGKLGLCQSVNPLWTRKVVPPYHGSTAVTVASSGA